MKREKVLKIAAVVTALSVLGGLVLNEVTKPKEYIYYYPIVYVYRESLMAEFDRHGINFGFSVGSSSFENTTTRPIIEKHAAIVTTEVALKMKFTQPEQGVFDFSEADAIVAYADELGIGVHGHTASWSLQNPEWLTDGNFSRYELEQILTNHVRTLSQHYDGRLISLDSANEGFLGCGPWCPLGTNTYVGISFVAASQPYPYPAPDGALRDPTVPLIYNSLFFDRAEENYALALLDNGTIDGIGIQLHLVASTDWEAHLTRVDKFLYRIRQHGGYARFSEVGVHMHLGEEQAQAEVYAAVTALAIKHKDIVKDFVVWGVKDPAWRGDVTLFDRAGNPKPSYYAMMEELR